MQQNALLRSQNIPIRHQSIAWNWSIYWKLSYVVPNKCRAVVKNCIPVSWRMLMLLVCNRLLSYQSPFCNIRNIFPTFILSANEPVQDERFTKCVRGETATDKPFFIRKVGMSSKPMEQKFLNLLVHVTPVVFDVKYALQTCIWNAGDNFFRCIP